MRPLTYALTLAALLAPIPIGGIALLAGVSYGPGAPTTQDLPDWYLGILVWSILVAVLSYRLALTSEPQFPVSVPKASTLLHRILAVYALIWAAAISVFLIRYYRTVGGFWGLLIWERHTTIRRRIDWLPCGIVPFYLYTFLAGMLGAVKGLDRLKSAEEQAKR